MTKRELLELLWNYPDDTPIYITRSLGPPDNIIDARYVTGAYSILTAGTAIFLDVEPVVIVDEEIQDEIDEDDGELKCAKCGTKIEKCPKCGEDLI